MTEECMREIFTPVAVCSNCRRKLTIYELHPTYKQNWLLKHELFRRSVHECKYCGCELEEQDYIRESVNIKGAGDMDIKNLTETEKNTLYKLLKKMENQNKPEKNTFYHYIDDCGNKKYTRWLGTKQDEERYRIGNYYATAEDVINESNKIFVKQEMERIKKQYSTLQEKWDGKQHHYNISYLPAEKRLAIMEVICCKAESTTYFESRDLARKVIDEIGKEKIIKYLFNGECEVKK